MAFTLDTYAHVLPGMQADAAEDLADRVFGPSETAAHEDAELEDELEDEDDEPPEPSV